MYEERKNPADYTGWGYVFLIDGLIKRVNEFLILGEYEAAYNSLESLYSETIGIITKKAEDKKEEDIPDPKKEFEKYISYKIKKAKQGITHTDLARLEKTRNTLRSAKRVSDKEIRLYHEQMSILTHKADLRFKEYKRDDEPITRG